MIADWNGPDGSVRLAEAVRRIALHGAPVGKDPILAALAAEARQFMHGACSLLASDLCALRGFVPVLIEARHPGQGWTMRHAMACPLAPEEAEAMVRSGRGLDLPVIDAAGGGTAGERIPLYARGMAEMRAVPGLDPDCATHWMWSRPQPPCSLPLLRTLPAACAALGAPFDLDDAMTALAVPAMVPDPREARETGGFRPFP